MDHWNCQCLFYLLKNVPFLISLLATHVYVFNSLINQSIDYLFIYLFLFWSFIIYLFITKAMIKLLWSINFQELTTAQKMFLKKYKIALRYYLNPVCIKYSYQVEKICTCQNKYIMNIWIKKNWDFKYFLLKILPPSFLFEYRYVCGFFYCML